MITVTKEAAEQILKSAEDSDTEDVYLRMAAKQEDNGNIEYGMGFDDINEDDMLIKSEGVRIIISPSSQLLLKDTVIDYVELEPGKFRFIFTNPNDARHKKADS